MHVGQFACMTIFLAGLFALSFGLRASSLIQRDGQVDLVPL